MPSPRTWRNGIMMICVRAPALPHFRPALRLAGPAWPFIGIQGRRTACAPARGRRAAADQPAAPARLGRPGSLGRADPAPARKATDAPADHPGHRPALAPPPDHPQVDLPEPHRTTSGQRRDHYADRAARHREQRLGIPENSRRAAQTRLPGQRVHHPPGPQGAEDPARHRNDAPTRLGEDSCTLRPRRCSPSISSTWTAR